MHRPVDHECTESNLPWPVVDSEAGPQRGTAGQPAESVQMPPDGDVDEEPTQRLPVLQDALTRTSELEQRNEEQEKATALQVAVNHTDPVIRGSTDDQDSHMALLRRVLNGLNNL